MLEGQARCHQDVRSTYTVSRGVAGRARTERADVGRKADSPGRPADMFRYRFSGTVHCRVDADETAGRATHLSTRDREPKPGTQSSGLAARHRGVPGSGELPPRATRDGRRHAGTSRVAWDRRATGRTRQTRVA